MGATALGGNFNKAALIFLTMFLPLLRGQDLPSPPWIQVVWGTVNIGASCYYSYLQIKATPEKHGELLKDVSDSDVASTCASSCITSDDEGDVEYGHWRGEETGARELATCAPQCGPTAAQ